METPQQRFERLLEQWERETSLSSRTEVEHPAHQEIVAMGATALPFIFAQLKREPRNLFAALCLITGANPIPEEHRGRVELMTQDWLRWAVKNGYLTEEDLN